MRIPLTAQSLSLKDNRNLATNGVRVNLTDAEGNVVVGFDCKLCLGCNNVVEKLYHGSCWHCFRVKTR